MKWLVLVLTAAMVLDHLEVGRDIVALAFGILFGGIVLTLALAVGLGSRELVSRSLESRVEHSGDRVCTFLMTDHRRRNRFVIFECRISIREVIFRG